MNPERKLAEVVTRHPGLVVLLFLAATLLFVPGLDRLEVQEDLEDFVVDTPEYESFQVADDRFGRSIQGGGMETWLIHVDSNALSRTSLLAMLRAQNRLESHNGLYVEDSESVAVTVARAIDPSATTRESQVEVLEHASEREVREALRAEVDDDLRRVVTDDFNEEAVAAKATIATVHHSFPGDVDTEQVTGTDAVVEHEQLRMRDVVDGVDGDIRVYGFGIMYHEFARVIDESMVLLLPVIFLLIVAFLGVAFRDPVDVLLGLVCLLVALLWTFGLMGHAGVPFTQLDVAIPPLMLAVGVDFSIHMVNRYREEGVRGHGRVESMDVASRQLMVAFFIVTVTTSIGFLANLASGLRPVREFGLVAGVSIVSVALVFGVLFPASKLLLDRGRDGRIPGSSQPLGREDSRLGVLLSYGAVPARRPWLFLVVVTFLTAGAAVYASDVETSFDEEDFLPPEEMPEYVELFPESMQPGEYTTKRDMSYVTEEFHADVVTVGMHLEGRLDDDHALEAMSRPAEDPPDSFVRGEDGEAQTESVVDVIHRQAAEDDEFAELVERSDTSGDGVPDSDVGDVYDALLASDARDDALRFMTEDRRDAMVRYYIESDALYEEVHSDAFTVADRHRMEASATGDVVIYSGVSQLVLQSAFTAFVAALAAASFVLVLVYRRLMGWGSLGVVNMAPILVTAVGVVATMRFLGIPFNALTATILAVTVGVGIDYSVHMTHRFADDYRIYGGERALQRTLRGTGGALTGSMATTVAGTGALVLAVTPILQEFGFLMVVSITYAYLTSVIVLPAALMAWDGWMES